MIQLLSKYKSYLFTFLLTLGMIFAVNIFAAEPSRTLGFQGQFYTYNTPGNAPVSATFTFYDSVTGGNVTGTPISKIIQVVNGYFGTTFSESDTTGVDLNQQLYLEVSINGTTLSPRTTVNPTVSSLKSFGTFSYISAPTVGPSGSLYFNTTTQELYVSNGTSWQLAGTASTTIQWTPNGTSLNYMAGNVGIGTTTPDSKLQVVSSGGFTPSLQTVASFQRNGSTVSDAVVSIIAGNVGKSYLNFGDTDNENMGRILYDHSLNSLGLGANGSINQLNINSVGNIGIGTTTPTSKLSLKGSTTGSGKAFSVYDSTDKENFFVLDSGMVNLGAAAGSVWPTLFRNSASGGLLVNSNGTVNSTSSLLSLRNNSGSDLMTVLGNGNVGIGTSSPVYKFHVEGIIGIAGTLGTITTSGTGNEINFSRPGANYISPTDASGLLMLGARGVQGVINISGGAANSMVVASTATANSLYLAGGNVGIGTSTPGSSLTVAGSIQQSAGVDNLTISSGASISVTNSLTLSAPNNFINIQSGNNYIYNKALAHIFLNQTGATEWMRIINGNVGIGTSTPSQILVASGTIQSTALLGGATTLSTDANGNIIRTPSDQKLKTNVETLTSALDKVNQMRGVSYSWIDTERFGKDKEIGFIAQELETIVPEVVKSGGEYKSVNYQNLTALLTEAIKELSAKFNNLSEVVKTKFVDADKVKTKELCIGDTCITEQEFKQVLQNRNTSSQTPPPAPAPTPAAEEPVVETQATVPTEPIEQ